MAIAERRVLADPTRVALAAAELVATAAAEAVQARGVFRVALSGGRSPEATYHLLASPEFRERVSWPRVHILFADERDAPPTEPESNYWLIRKLLVEPAGIPPQHVYRMKADATDLEAAARAYEENLAAPLDLLLLGVGEDGHIASLFPGSRLVRESERRAGAVHDSPKPPPRRLTITPRVLSEARRVLVLATGAAKAEAVRKALAATGDPSDCPARLVREADWIVDAAASARVGR